MGIAMEDIRFVLATHYHPDHAGLVQEVKRQGARLVVMEGQDEAIPRLKQWMKPAMQFMEIDRRDNTALTFAASRAFLAKLGVAGEIIPTPGHSDDSVTLVLDSGDAFTGDLEGESRAQDGALEIVRESWRKIRGLGARTAHPGHGPARPLGPCANPSASRRGRVS
jgi:glyoxylase-like metal-dependent hydrolase (beta-lactamase superfamily II)